MTYSDRAATIRAEVASLAYDADQALDAANALHNSDALVIDELRAKVAADVLLIETLRQDVADLTAKLAAATTSAPPPVVTPPPITTSPRLSWAPPALTNPLTIDLTPTSRKAFIPADRDAVVRIPAALRNVVGGIEINGGRNVRLIGGEIGYDTVDVSRALFIKGAAGTAPGGTVHIEGLLFSGTNIAGDAIDIDCQGVERTITLQNIDVSLGLAGSYTGNHSDAVQTWNGPNALRIDGMVVRRAAYQGFMLDPRKFFAAVPAPFLDFRNLHVVQNGDTGYALFNATVQALTGRNVKVRTGSQTNRVSYPAGAWPFVTAYTGTPLPDDRFLSGKPGMGYVSPGYA